MRAGNNSHSWLGYRIQPNPRRIKGPLFENAPDEGRVIQSVVVREKKSTTPGVPQRVERQGSDCCKRHHVHCFGARGRQASPIDRSPTNNNANHRQSDDHQAGDRCSHVEVGHARQTADRERDTKSQQRREAERQTTNAEETAATGLTQPNRQYPRGVLARQGRSADRSPDCRRRSVSSKVTRGMPTHESGEGDRGNLWDLHINRDGRRETLHTQVFGECTNAIPHTVAERITGLPPTRLSSRKPLRRPPADRDLHRASLAGSNEADACTRIVRSRSGSRRPDEGTSVTRISTVRNHPTGPFTRQISPTVTLYGWPGSADYFLGVRSIRIESNSEPMLEWLTGGARTGEECPPH